MTDNRFNIGYKFNVEYFRGIEDVEFTKGKEFISNNIEKIHFARGLEPQDLNEQITGAAFDQYKGLSKDCLELKNDIADSFPLTTTYPGLIIGSGYQHELKKDEAFKLGFFFDYTTGLPVIPGSSVKGLLRSMFPGQLRGMADKAEGEEKEALRDKATAQEAFIRFLLGKEDIDVYKLEKEIFEGYRNEDTQKQPHLTTDKWDIFYDAYIESSTHKGGTFMGEDYITPHMKDGDPKNLLKNPIPLKFLKVLPNVTFRFQFDLKDGIISHQEKLKLFAAILKTIGAGAKTNVGYGQFEDENDLEIRYKKRKVQEKHSTGEDRNTKPVESAEKQPATVTAAQKSERISNIEYRTRNVEVEPANPQPTTRQHNKKTTTLNLTLDLPLDANRLRSFRGAIAELAGWENDHFHNHKDAAQTYRRASQIQYRTQHGKAAIYAIGEGVEQLRGLLAKSGQKFMMRGREHTFRIRDLHERDIQVRLVKEQMPYKVNRWIALNSDNFRKWQDCKDLVAKIRLLENTLTGHILGLCEGLDFMLDEKLEVHITDLRHIHTVNCFGTQHLAFDINYTANINLPDGIGIGKGATLGFGVQGRYKEKTAKKTNRKQKDKKLRIVA